MKDYVFSQIKNTIVTAFTQHPFNPADWCDDKVISIQFKEDSTHTFWHILAGMRREGATPKSGHIILITDNQEIGQTEELSYNDILDKIDEVFVEISTIDEYVGRYHFVMNRLMEGKNRLTVRRIYSEY